MNDKTKHLRPIKHHLLSVVKGECKQSRSRFFLATATTRGLPLPGFRTGIGADPKIVGWRRFDEKKSFGKKCFLMHSSSDHPCPCWRSYRSAMTSSSGVEMCDTYVNIDTNTDTNINLNIEIIVLRNKHFVKCSNR